MSDSVEDRKGRNRDPSVKRRFRKGRCGTEFKKGKCYLFWERSVHVVCCWPSPSAWHRCEEHGWRRCFDVPDFDVPIEHSSTLPGPEPQPISVICTEEILGLPTYEPDASDEENLCLWHEHELSIWKWRRRKAAFWAPVPVAIRDAVSQYSHGQWRVLNLLARCPKAMDLHHSNPALCFALAHHDLLRSPPERERYGTLRRRINRKQKSILGWLGFPATEAARRLLRKFRAEDVTLQALIELRHLLADQNLAKNVSHLPRLSEGLVRIISTPDLLATVPMKLLLEISASDPFDACIIEETFTMCRQLGMPWPRRLRSMDDAWGRYEVACCRGEAHLDYEARLDELSEGAKASPFPPAPFRGTKEIVPIRTGQELAEEGRIMSHCAGSLRGAVLNGEVYVYQVLAPIRATLSILRDAEGWRPSLCSGFANQPVPTDVVECCFAALFASQWGDEEVAAIASAEALAARCQQLGLNAEQQKAARRCLCFFCELAEA